MTLAGAAERPVERRRVLVEEVSQREHDGVRAEVGISRPERRACAPPSECEDDRLELILPLVKKYDAAIIALPNDHDEIPMEADKRVNLVFRIKIAVDNPQGLLKPGMPADADILL